MYRCDDCGHFFQEPVVVHEDPSPSGVSLTSGYYTEWYCPSCGSDKVEEAGSCASCGEPVKDGDTLCENCKENLQSYLDDIAKDMHMTKYELMCALEEL